MPWDDRPLFRCATQLVAFLVGHSGDHLWSQCHDEEALVRERLFLEFQILLELCIVSLFALGTKERLTRLS